MAQKVEDGKLYTPAEVALLFRVDAKTVTRWAVRGKLPCVKTPAGTRRFWGRDINTHLSGDHDGS